MLYALIVVIAIFVDQISKWLVVNHLKDAGTLPLIKDVLHLTYSENDGAAFSILKGMQSFLVIFTSIAMALMFVYMVKLGEKKGSGLLSLALSFVIAGGIGNLIDRLRMGYVVDFVDFRLINFAIFNVADVFITVGAALLIVDTLFGSKILARL